MANLFLEESILNTEREEEHPNWRMYLNGVVNIHRNWIRAILISPSGAHYPMAVKLTFPVPTTWPSTKLLSLVWRLLQTSMSKIQKSIIHFDNQPIYKRIADKEPRISHIKKVCNQDPQCFLLRVLQLFVELQESIADALATLASVIKISDEKDLCPIVVETHDRPVYDHNVESKLDGNPWHYNIKTFLKDGRYP